MQDAVRIIGTVIVVIGLGLILWRELAAAGERRKVGPARDVAEVLLPIVATVALVIWVWI
jgi:hypothetical protein